MLVFFLAVAMITGMTVYFKRALQARIRDARFYMLNEINARAGTYYTGDLYYEYEPYYANTVSFVARTSKQQSNLLPGAASGNFIKTFDDITAVRAESETAPPKDAN